MASVLNDSKLEALLAPLHAKTTAQTDEINTFFRDTFSVGNVFSFEEGEGRAFFADMLVALERDKAEFCYLTCRALGAKRLIEVGTSHGASTCYLAAALRDNGGGTVIATEYEAKKAAIARALWAEAGLSSFIELREGDLRETLKALDGPIDFVLVDIWTDMARPALELIYPHLRKGAVVICDNTISARSYYNDYFAFIASKGDALRTQTLPFEGGLEMTVRL